MPELSKYELEREANIARNRAILEQLELKQAVEDLGFRSKSQPPPKTKAKPIQPAKKAKKEQSEVEGPRRQSARLRNIIDPDESPAKKRKREAEIEEQRAKEAEARLEAEERTRAAKRPRHEDLGMKVLSEDDPEEAITLSRQLQTLPQQPRRTADPEAYVFDEDKKEQREVEELRKRLQKLKVVSRAKVTQDRIYSATYHPEPTKDLIFFGDKHGQLGIWDARAPPEEVDDEEDGGNSDEREGGKYWRLQVHWPATSKSSISSVKLDPTDSHTVYTSSYDCSVRALSFTTGVSREVFMSEDGVLVCSVDLPPSGHEMWVSDTAGGLTHLDLRQPKSKARWYGLAEPKQKIGCVSVNPTRPHFLATASLSRAMQIWDVRKLQTLTSKSTPIEFDYETVHKFVDSSKGAECLRAAWRHDKSVSSAYWDPRGRSIVSTSYDDALRVWDFDSSVFKEDSKFPSSRPVQRLGHDCQTGRWLTVLKAQWNPNPDIYPHFTVGNMKHSLDIFTCKGELITRLTDRNKITAVQAVTCSHPSIVERAASGNASGRCVLWAPVDDA
ncbi:WD40 repeat-like protein [Marasmius fiardii PR-910]|nr:WD40 repeat-like protein [Marasmius fiardii PR-910]